ncbi:MAG: DUF1552 domain-containing protein [Myxococcota bacterium]
MIKPLSRRTVLRGVGGSVLALPFLEAMRSRRASADEVDGLVDGRIQRLIVVFKGNGMHQPSFYPEPGGTFVGTTLEPLEAYRDRSLILDGVKLQSALDSEGEMHQTGMGSLLSGRRLQNTGEFSGGGGATAGWGNGITIDQTIAERVRGNTRFKSLELGIRANVIGSEVRTRLNYRGPGDPISPVDNPQEVFDRLFAGVDTDAEERERLRQRRQRVVDAVQDQFRRVRQRVGTTDQQRLDRHLSFIDELETRVGGMGAGCVAPERPRDFGTSRDAVPDISRAQIDLLVSAFACDLTRVGSLQYSTGAYHIRFPWLGDDNQGHSLGHATARRDEAAVDPNDRDKTERTRLWNNRIRWYAGEIAYLLQRLEETPDGDGSLLDSTAVLWTSENANPHHYLTRIPFVFFGTAGGKLQTGMKQYADPFDSRNHVNHNRMLVALQQAYGIESNTFGEPEYCEGGALDILR